MTENEALEELNVCIGDCVYLGCGAGAMHEAIKALNEIQKYRSIGTVEECREARERQMAKKPIKQKCELTDDEVEQLVDLGFQGRDVLRCPCCNEFIVIKDLKYCMDCGQKLHWSEVGE